MLHDRRNDADFVKAIEAVRQHLAAAKDRVREVYPRARIRWVVETSTWAVVDVATGDVLETSPHIEEVATGRAGERPRPISGTHRRVGPDED